MIHPEIEQRDRLLHGIATATNQLLTEKDYSQAVNLALTTLGTAAAADRAYIFENHFDPQTGEPLMSQRWEWAMPGIQAEIDNPALQNLPYQDCVPRWYETLLRGEVISGPVQAFPDSERKLLESQQILSVLVIPIYVEQRFWGFIGFDACSTERIWSASETALLQAAAASISGRLRQHHMERDLEAQVEQRTAALQKSETRLHRLTDNVPGMLFEFRQRPDGSRCFPYASAGTQALLNVEPQLLKLDVSLAFAEVHPEDLPGLEQSIQVSAVGLSDWEYEWRVNDQDNYRWLKGCSRPQRQPNGDILWYGYIFDTSDRKRAELLQQQQQQQLESFLDNIPHLAWLKDQKSRFIAANKPFSQFCGKPVDNLVGKTDFDLWSAELAQSYQRGDKAVMASRQQQWVEEQIAIKGQTRWFETYKTPVLDAEGKAIGTVGIAVDITERREAEAALRQSEAKLRQQTQVLEKTLQQLQQTQGQMVQSEKMSSLGQLVAGIAHEINNPVSFIYGNMSHLQEYADDLIDLIQLYQTIYPETTAPIQAPIQAKIQAIDLAFLQSDLPKILRSMETGAERISEIVSSLSNFSRMDQTGKKAADIHEGLDSTLLILGHRLKIQLNRPEIEVIREYGDLPQLECNPGQLNQVFMNIFSNAIDALETAFTTRSIADSSPILTLKVMTGVDRGFATIRIADNGSGMPPDVVAKIYEPFFHDKAARSRDRLWPGH